MGSRLRRLALTLLATASAAAGAADKPPRFLCKPGETVLFGCRADHKMISVCASRGFTSDTGYVQYRYGTPARVELAWPERLLPATGRFWLSDAPHAGGGESHLRFVNQGVEYLLFDRTVRTNDTPGEPNDPAMAEGVVVRVPGGKPVVRLCDDDQGGIRKEAYDQLDREDFVEGKVPDDVP